MVSLMNKLLIKINAVSGDKNCGSGKKRFDLLFSFLFDQ